MSPHTINSTCTEEHTKPNLTTLLTELNKNTSSFSTKITTSIFSQKHHFHYFHQNIKKGQYQSPDERLLFINLSTKKIGSNKTQHQ
jgi:hypothetical protein